MSSINTPNATCYYKPIITINEWHPADRPHISEGFTVPCRVMPKSIKFFYQGDFRTSVKQVKRVPGEMTITSKHLGRDRVGYIVMNNVAVAERMVATSKTVIHSINASSSLRNWDSTVVPTAEVDEWFLQKLIGAGRVAGATASITVAYNPPTTCRVIEATPTTVKAEFNNNKSIDRVSYAITSGTLHHKEIHLGDGQWFAIDNGLKHDRHSLYDDWCHTVSVMPDRFNTAVLKADNNDPWLVSASIPLTPYQVAQEAEQERQRQRWREDAVRRGGVVINAGTVAFNAPVAWEPTAQQVATALAVPRTVMPGHIKERMVLLGTTLKEQWQCCVCADDHEPSLKVMTDCGHYLCEGCQVSWKAKQKAERKPVWNCPECRCPHAY